MAGGIYELCFLSFSAMRPPPNPREKEVQIPKDEEPRMDITP